MTSKKRYHHGDLRRTLLDQAALLLREEGETGLSMRALAARAGVSRSAPYHHFRGKQDLLCAIAEEGFRRYRQLLLIEGEELSQQRILRFVRDYLDFAVNNAEYYDLMFGSKLWQSDGISESLRAQAHASFRDYRNQVRDWQRQGLINPGLDPLRYAQVSWSTLHGMSRLLIDGVYPGSAARGAMCDQAAAMLWRELRPD